MSEENPQNPIEGKKARRIELAREIAQSNEIFSFPGIDDAAYERIKSEEEKFPGLSTPIDEQIKRFKDEGIKVILGNHPESGNVFIMPAKSHNIEMDSLLPSHLNIESVTSGKLAELINLFK